MGHPTRVIVVDDHAFIRSGVRAVLEAERPPFAVVGEAATADEAIELCAATQPDVAIVDLRLGGMDGITATRMMLARTPCVHVVMLSSYDGDESIHRALEAGARAYLLKDSPPGELARAIRALTSGKRYVSTDVAMRMAINGPRVHLTAREGDVLSAIADGLRTDQIALRIDAEGTTVRTHVQNILSKFGCSDRGAAIAAAIARGFILR